MIVEDDPVISKFHCRLVGGLQGRMECVVARTSKDAIRVLEGEPLDLILLDVQLAEATSGRRFLVHCHHLFERSPEKRLPVVVVSGIDRKELEGLAKAYPFIIAVFSKPFDMDELLALVGEALAGK